MKTKSRNYEKKLETKAKIEWYLRVGFHFGTISGPKKIMEILQIDRVTYYRWATGKVAAPYSALELLRLYAFGEPPGGRSAAWRGFRFQNDVLITDDGRTLTPRDLKAVFFWRQMAFDNLSAHDRRDLYSELRTIYQRA